MTNHAPSAAVPPKIARTEALYSVISGWLMLADSLEKYDKTDPRIGLFRTMSEDIKQSIESATPSFVDVEYFCFMTGYKPDTVRKMCRNGKLASTKLGNRYLIATRELDKLSSTPTT